MHWTKLIPRIRRFDHHPMKEIVLKAILPNDWDSIVSLKEIDHQPFDLVDSELYDPNGNKPHQRGPIRGFVVERGVLWPAVGAIRSVDGGLIEESFLDHNSRRISIDRGYLRRYSLVHTSGAAATLGHLYRNYYHRWSDAIPRIYSLYHPFVKEIAPLKLYVDGRFSQEELHVIRYLIPEYVELVVSDFTVRVQADRCVHLPFMSGDRIDPGDWLNSSAGYIPLECLDWLREGVYDVLNLQPDKPFRKLFITRRFAKVRRLKNEKEVASYLQGQGFEVVALERLTLREQVQRFAEAHTVVAQHGAGLTNLLFAQSPQVLEICSDDDPQVFFKLISESRGFRHVQIHREGTNKNDDVSLPIPELKEALISHLDQESTYF